MFITICNYISRYYEEDINSITSCDRYLLPKFGFLLLYGSKKVLASLNGLHSLCAGPKYVSPILIIFGVGFKVLDLLPDLTSTTDIDELLWPAFQAELSLLEY